MVATIAFAYSQGWTKISMIPMFVIGFIGIARAFAGLTMNTLSQKLATMPLEKRAKFRAGMSDDQWRKLLAKYGIVVFDARASRSCQGKAGSTSRLLQGRQSVLPLLWVHLA